MTKTKEDKIWKLTIEHKPTDVMITAKLIDSDGNVHIHTDKTPSIYTFLYSKSGHRFGAIASGRFKDDDDLKLEAVEYIKILYAEHIIGGK